MKKTYKNPTLNVKLLNGGGGICESLIVGSGNTNSTRGNGVDLVKEDRSSRGGSNYNVWDDDWSKE